MLMPQYEYSKHNETHSCAASRETEPQRSNKLETEFSNQAPQGTVQPATKAQPLHSIFS